MSSRRSQKQPDSILLPPCPLPRPGDKVTWFQEARRETGVLTGHTAQAIPIVTGRFKREHHLTSYHALRLIDPFKRVGPVWEELPESTLWSTTAEETQMFNDSLYTTIPPGLTYFDLVEEIWSRGFEVFLVGGMVRDILTGLPGNDIDIVTTMPIELGLDVLKPMFRHRKLDITPKTGYCRLGGSPRNGDPFIDLKMVCLDNLGTENARFGANLLTDVGHRDFACNALYYDPMNELVVDPTEKGMRDAEEKKLTLVANRSLKSSLEAAKIAIRYFKFIARGFEPRSETIKELSRHFIPELSSLPRSIIVSYTRTQIVSKYNKSEWETKLDLFRQDMDKMGHNKEWLKHFEPLKEDILMNGRNR